MTPLRLSRYFLFALTLVVAASTAVAQEKDKRLPPDGPGWRVDEAVIKDPKLPRVLLIGDSILNGYLKPVRAALDGQANIDAWVNPYSQASYKLDKMVADVLARADYDIIHFNMGLHGWQKGRIPEGKFEPLTRQLVEELRKGAPHAKLIWASSTPVTVKKQPGQADPEINPIIIQHNAMAAKVMGEMQVPIDDLYSVVFPHLDLARGDQFHWTPAGVNLLAKAVTASLKAEIQKLPAK